MLRLTVSRVPRGLGALALALLLAVPATAQKALRLEDVAPGSTLLYVSFAGLDEASASAENLGLYQLWKEPQFQAFVAPIIEGYHQAARSSPDEMVAEWQAMRDLFRGRIGVALTGISLSSMPPMPAALAALDVGEERERVQGFWETTVNSISENMGVEVVRSTATFKDHEIRLYTVEQEQFTISICTAFVQNLFIVSVNQGPIRKAINLSQREDAKSLTRNEAFANGRKKAGDNPLVEMYVSTENALKRSKFALKRFLPDGEAMMEAVEILGLLGIRSAYYASTVEDGDAFDTLYLDAPTPRKGLLDLAGQKPLSPESMRMVPPGALACVGLRVDAGKAWDHVMEALNHVPNPDVERMLEEMDREIGQVEDEIGLSLRKDILACIGEEMVVYADVPRDWRIPKVVLSVAIRDRDRAQRVLHTLLAQLPLTQREVSHGDHKMMLVKMRREIPASPCYCLQQDRLLISPTLSGLREALDRLDGQGPSLVDNPNFKETFRGLPWDKASAIHYLDTKRVLDVAYEAATDVLPGLIDPSEFPIDPVEMPTRDVFARHIRSLGGVWYGDEDGLVMRARTLGLATVLPIAARIALEAPGAPHWAIERMSRSLGRSLSVGARAGSSSRPVRGAPPTDSSIINPLAPGDPAEKQMRSQLEDLRSSLEEDPTNAGLTFNVAMLEGRLRNFEAAAKGYQRARELGFGNQATASYNAACMYSLMNKKTEAIAWLKQAFEDGFDSATHIDRDSDLDNLRKDERFQKLIKEHRGRELR